MNQDLLGKSQISVVLVFFTTLAIIGLVCAGFIVTDYSRARSSASWRMVEGVILSERGGEQGGVRYIYSVDGRSYESTRRWFFTTRISARRNQPDYRAGGAVDVYVSPHAPSFSVLTPGGSSIVFVIVSLISGACIFTGAGGVIRTLETAVAAGGALEGGAPWSPF